MIVMLWVVGALVACAMTPPLLVLLCAVSGYLFIRLTFQTPKKVCSGAFGLVLRSICSSVMLQILQTARFSVFGGLRGRIITRTCTQRLLFCRALLRSFILLRTVEEVGRGCCGALLAVQDLASNSKPAK